MSAPLTMPAARSQLREAFAPCDPGCWGLEVEWLIHPRDDPTARPAYRQLTRFAGMVLPAGGRVTLEPGGQLELSTAPRRTVDDAIDALEADAEILERLLADDGLLAVDAAVDLQRLPLRILDLPRYRAMESFFDAGGPAGRWMMCNTASVQVNLGHDPDDPDGRWRLLNRLAPVLLAAFANSPGRDASGRPWASLRQGIWGAIDPGRTAAPLPGLAATDSWTEYVMAADVMLVREGDDALPCAPGLPFRRWLEVPDAVGRPPTVDDLRYHATTLFPPVRPRGWLELRALDALPGDTRSVAALVVAACLQPEAARTLSRHLADDREAWSTATSRGLSDAPLAAAADLVFDVATASIRATTDRAHRRDAVTSYADRYVAERLQPWGGRVGDHLPRTLVDLHRLDARPAMA